MSCNALFRSLIAALALLIASSAALASSVGGVTQIPTYAYMRAHNLAGTPNIRLAGYASDTDGGQGAFTLGSCTDTYGTHTNDGGVIIQDSANNCFYRQFHGPVSLRWYGVANATSSACLASRSSCAADTAVAKAFIASAWYGDGGVLLDGLSIVINTGDLTIPTKQYLDGGAQTLGARDSHFYAQVGYIALNPTYTVRRMAQTTMRNVLIIPTWYVPTIIPANIGDSMLMRQMFTGTGTTCADHSCAVENVTIAGFDVCDDTSSASTTVLRNMWLGCNIGEYNHHQREGMKIENIVAFSENLFLNAKIGIDTSIVDMTWPISAVANASGAVQVTLDTSDDLNNQYTHINVGDTVVVSDLGDDVLVHTEGTLTAGLTSITDIPAISDNNKEDSNLLIQPGFTVDAVTGSCVQPHTIVTAFSVDASGVGTATISPALVGLCNARYSELEFGGKTVAPPSGNGRWRVKARTTNAVTLEGSTWAGPTFTGVTWRVGAYAVHTYDTTNIMRGQYFCVSGNGPFCTIPAEYAFSTATADAGLNALGTTGVGAIDVSSTSNWPSEGLVKAGTEYMQYTVVNETSIKITRRGADATTAATHADGVTLTAAAPVVIAVVPSDNAVLLSVPAQGNGTGTIKFDNDTALASGSVGLMRMSAYYGSWTGLTAGGGTPDATLVVPASASNGSTALTVTANPFKIMKGMTIVDQTTASRIPAGTVVSSVTGSVVTMSNAAASAISGDKIVFDGCGYPTNQPWKGNCAGTAILFGGDALFTQGITCEWLHTHYHTILIHLKDSPATSCVNYIIDGGGAAANDPSSVGLWLDGFEDKTQFTNGRMAGVTIGILGSIRGGGDGIGIYNTQLGAHTLAFVSTGNGVNMVLSGLRSHMPPAAYVSAQQESLIITDSNLPRVRIYFDDAAALNTIYCSADVVSALSVCLSASANASSAVTAVTNAPNGEVYLSYNVAGLKLQLCPFNGFGALAINGTTQYVPGSCVNLPATATTGPSVKNFIYANFATAVVSGTTANSGAVQVTLGKTTGFQTGDKLTCSNIAGTTEANGTWVGTLDDATHITLVGSVYVNAFINSGDPKCQWVGLIAATNGHVTVGGIEVRTNKHDQTLVGLVYMDNGSPRAFNDSLAMRDVASWYNRQLKPFQVALGNHAATTVRAAYRTPASFAVEGEFVLFAPQGTPGNGPNPSVEWRINAGGANSNIATVNSMAVQFGTSSLGLDAVCGTPSVAHSTQTQAVAGYYQGYTVTSQSTITDEGLNYMDLCIQASANTFTLENSETTIGATLWQ